MPVNDLPIDVFMPFMKAIKNGVIISDTFGNIVLSSPACEKLFGYASAELKGMNVRELTPPAIRDAHDRYIDDYLRSGNAKIIGIGRELEARHRNGQTFPIHLSVSKAEINGEKYFIGEIEDRREQRRQMLELYRQQSLLVEFADSIPALAARVDRDMYYRLVNRTYEKWLGRDRSTIVNQRVDQVLGPEIFERVRGDIEKALSGDEVVTEIEMTYPGTGILTARIHYKPIFTPDGRPDGYIVLSTDISDLKLLEYQLRTAKEHAEIANSAKSRFLANMSHELRTPLNAVIGFSEMLELSLIKDHSEETLKSYVGHIADGGRMLLALVDQLLDLARIENDKLELTLEPFLLNEEIDNISSAFEIRAHENNVTIANDLLSRDYVLRGDSLRIRQILHNLVGNAIKFAPGGTVGIKTQTHEQPENRVLVQIDVEDDGIGIPREQLDTIFDPFSREDESLTRQYGGAGLGLSICRNLVTMMGGELTVESVQGKGSKFTVKIEMDDLTGTENALEALAARDLGTEAFDLTILAVDDTASNLNIVEQMLGELGCRVVRAARANSSQRESIGDSFFPRTVIRYS